MGLDIVAFFQHALHIPKRFSAPINLAFLKESVTIGFGQVRVDLAKGVFEDTTPKNPTT
jgi:hypothetical protein